MPKFVDRVVVHATAGAGGNGCASVHREKFKPLGGPDGGNGGRAAPSCSSSTPACTPCSTSTTARTPRPRNGKQGQGGFRAGANADDLDWPSPTAPSC